MTAINLLPGAEQWESFSPAHRRNQTFVQYDYRHSSGELFSCVAPSLEEARRKRNRWAEQFVDC